MSGRIEIEWNEHGERADDLENRIYLTWGLEGQCKHLAMTIKKAEC